MTEWIISSSVLICALMLLRGLLRGKVNPRIQYALWAIVLVRLLMPFSLFQSGLSIQNLHEEVRERPAVQQVYQAMSTPIVPSGAGQTGALPPVTQQSQPPVTQQTQTPAVDPLPQQNPGSTPGQTVPDASAPDVERSISLSDILTHIWIGGIVVMALWMAGCNLSFSRRLKGSRRPVEVPDSLLEVYATDAVETPCLFGLFHPAVYLTPEVAGDDRIRRYVLTHELTHYRQFDHVWAVLRAVALVLHWYNPLVWISFRASRQDGEMACDKGTLKELGEEHRGDYGRTLIGLATRTRFRGTLVTATTMAGGKRAIKERIVILMKNPKTALMTMVSLILVCTLIVGCTFTGAVEKPTEPGETTPIETTEPAETTVPVPEETEDDRISYFAEYLTSNTWMYMAMNCVFDTPEEIDMEYYFREGIETIPYDPYGYAVEDQNLLAFLDSHNMIYPAIMPVEKMGNILKNIFGITVEDVISGIPESWFYFEETDSYYTPTSNLPRMANFQITSVAELDENIVQVSYTPIDNNFYLNGQQMLLTLYQVKEDTYRALSNQILYSEDQDYTVLTTQQIAQVNEAFVSTRYWQEGAYTMAASTPINGFFRCYYSTPEEINLRDFLRHFSAYGIVDGWYEDAEYVSDWRTTVTESEFADLVQEDDWPWENVTSMDRMPVPIHKMLSEDIDAVLRHYTGIGLNQLHNTKENSGMFYSEQYDAYYNFTSDYGPGYFNCIGGRIYGDHVELYDDANHILTLVEQDGKYYIYSYTPYLWDTPVELTADGIAQVNEFFGSSGDSIQVKAINCFFTSYYEDPTQIDLKEFLRHFTVKGLLDNKLPEVTEEEFDDIRLLDGFPFPDVENLEDMPVPTHKYPSYLVNEVLLWYANVSLNSLADANGKGDAFYSEKYDAYYNHTSDFAPGTFHCIGGANYGSYVELYSENSILTLQWNDGRYYIVSHLPKV